MSSQIALSGLNAASIELESVSNNIANNATTGFKRSNVQFADVYSASTVQAARLSPGNGVTVAAVRQDFEQGDVSFTNSNLDLSIGGQGFFQLDDGGKAVYSRAGAFGLDREGFITNPKDQKLIGYPVNDEGEVLPITGELKIDFSDLRPKATSGITLAANLDAGSEEMLVPFDVTDPSTFSFSTSTTVHDTLGSSQIATMYMRKEAPNSWSSFLFVDGVDVGKPGGEELMFGTDGMLASVNGAPEKTFTSTTFTPPTGGADMTLEFDIDGLTQYENPNGTNRITQDGNSAGRLDDFDVDNTGLIYGRYSNGQSRLMGQVALSNFANPEGLLKQGDNNWAETFNSGEPTTGTPGSASLGMLQAGALEGSNVDITAELVAMIGAQRSFQANAKVISADDTLAQTVINIGR